MEVFPGIIEPRAGSFEGHSRDEILRNLDAHEPNWRWSVPLDPAEVCSFKYRRQDLPSTSISSGEHSVSLQALARRSRAVIGVFFVLAGEIEIIDRRRNRTLCISANHVASARESAGKQLSIQPLSRWLAFHIPESTLRQHFEDLTGRPYVQEFALPLTGFCQSSAHGLYHTLREAEDDLSSASVGQGSILARAYQQLALVKLFTKMPHNLADAFGCGTLSDAPRQLLRAEAFMRERLSSPITLEDLADAADCRPRALQRLFRTYRGDSPMGILRNYRLAAAHSAIRAGRTTSIAELAMSLQFFNPGRFSALYKKAYGISPSSTLRFARSESATETP